MLGFVKRPALMRVPERIAAPAPAQPGPRPRAAGAGDARLHVGCKRILPSNRWYPALGEPNVELVTDPIREVREHAIVTADGTEREVDAIIFGTGFRVADMPIGEWVRGRGGQRLADAWHGQPARAPRRDGRRVPQPVRAPRPEHRPRPQLDGLHDRVPDRARGRRAPRDAGAGGGVAEVRAEAQAAYNREIDAQAGRHGVEHGLRELVPRPHRAQRDQLAGLDLALPAAHPALRPVRAPAHVAGGRPRRAAA